MAEFFKGIGNSQEAIIRVIPAKAGIWIPAYAGMTKMGLFSIAYSLLAK